MSKLNKFGYIDSKTIAASAKEGATPFYLYDEAAIIDKCKAALAMANPFGINVRYAMKANSNRTLLKIINSQGLMIDASSMNEARRAHIAGIPYSDIILTTQEVPLEKELHDLKKMMSEGLKYNVCSLRQLHNIGDFASENKIKLGIRYHPGVGSGESATRNTGDNYSCFGVHLSDLQSALDYSKSKGIEFDLVHVHIGSGGDPKAWQNNIDYELAIIEKHFPHALSVNFGGGLKVARMPNDTAADIAALGEYAKLRIEEFYAKTGRKLKMEIEPGTFIIAEAGYIVTKVIDKKSTGKDGFNFLVLDGGMEVNTRPLLYAAKHPFYVVSKEGELLSSEFDLANAKKSYMAVPVGRCCESGDAQSLDDTGLTVPRQMAEPEVGDYLVIGGGGAYCSAMSPFNYNSHEQAAELLYTKEKNIKVIRKLQSLEQILINEV